MCRLIWAVFCATAGPVCRLRQTLEAGAGHQGCGERKWPRARNVSVTWYTWLEQGRGGPPSTEVLERLAGALELDTASREVLFLLAQQRQPPVKRTPLPSVTPALQRVLDAFATSPAYLKTPIWDIVGWNAAALAVLTDYSVLPLRQRNVLRRMFSNPAYVERPGWEADARFALASFRVDAARSGDGLEAAALAAELRASSAAFRRLWAENEMRSHWVGLKHVQHPVAGALTLEYSTFSVDSAAGLSMIVFTPTSAVEAEAIGLLVSAKASK